MQMLTIMELTNGHKVSLGIVLVLILLVLVWVFRESPDRRQARLARREAHNLSFSLLDYIIDEDGLPAGLAEANRLNSEAAAPLANRLQQLLLSCSRASMHWICDRMDGTFS
jgi:hypothetical protein